MKPKELIKLIKKSSFDDYQDDTIGELIEDFFTYTEYEAIEDEEGNVYVNVTGGVEYDGEDCEMLIQFAITNNYESIFVNAIEIDGEPHSEDGIAEAIEVIYRSYHNEDDEYDEEDDDEDDD